MDFSQMKEQLRQSLQPKRFEHSVAVSETAVALARHYGVDEDKAALAGLLHDCARKYPTKDFVEVSKKLGVPLTDIEKAQPILIHAILGPLVAKRDYGVTDEEVLSAMRYHTTGKAHMTALEKIIYLADLTEPHRDFPTVEEMRRLTMKDLDEAMIAAYANTMEYLMHQHLLIHPDCLDGYNELVLAAKHNKKE